MAERNTTRRGAKAASAASREPAELIVVLGMHRSGTSVITRALQALGVCLGDNLMPPKPGENDKGYFEDMDIYRLNERLLGKLGSAWHRLGPIDEAALSGPSFSGERREAATLLERKLRQGRFAFKDPRTCILLPLWRCVIEDLTVSTDYVLAVRNPMEVAASLEARDHFAMTKGLVLWAKHMLAAVRHTEGCTRVFVSFEQLFKRPEEELERLSHALCLPPPDRDEVRAFCHEFLEAELRHNRISGNELARAAQAPPFVARLFALLEGCTSGRPCLDMQALSDIRQDYESSLTLLVHADELAAARAKTAADLKLAVSRTEENQRAVEDLRAKLAASEAAFKTAEVANAEQARALDAALEAQQTALAELKAVRERVDALQRQLLSERASGEASLSAARAEAEALLSAKAELEGRTVALEAALAAAQAEASAERAGLERLREDFAARSSELEASLEAVRAEAVAQRSLLTAARDELAARHADLHAALETAKAEAAAERSALTAARDELAARHADLHAALETARAEAAAAVSVHASEKDEFSARCSELYATLGAAKAEAATTMERALAAFDAERKELQGAISQTQAERDRSVAMTADLEDALSSIRREHVLSAAQVETANLEIARQTARLNELGQQHSSLAAELTRLREKAAAQEHVSDSLVQQLAVLSRDYNAMLQRSAELEALLGQHENEKEKLKEEAAARTQEQENLKAELGRQHQALAELSAAAAARAQQLQSALADARSQKETNENLSRTLSAQQEELERLSARAQDEVGRLRDELVLKSQEAGDLRRDLLLTRGALTATRTSTSWRLTAPMRAAVSLMRRPLGFARALVRRARRHPIAAPPAEAPSPQRAFSSPDNSAIGNAAPLREDDDSSLAGYVELAWHEPPAELRARAIAFYLPQFHSIPENDAWWGKGFTEWTKVRPARPRFEGHRQPNEPGELGYYDLMDDEGVLERQAELAKLHGISGFCFYFYWFAGKRLLEGPIQRLHANPRIDMPFCLCWANENWTRRWDGQDSEVLIAQAHSPADDLAFIEHVSQYFNDPRYIRIGGRPLLVVYRPALFPSARETAQRWRNWLRENGFGEVFLACTQSFESASPALYGFDAAIEFPPNNMGIAPEPPGAVKMAQGASVRIYDWRKLAKRPYAPARYKLFRGVTPQWDNTPRRPDHGAVFINTSPTEYRNWLSRAVEDTEARFTDPEERLIFINAWNEWAEGAYLEPDKRRGYAWLAATRQALASEGQPKAIVVTHDLYRHGAQYIALNLARTLKQRFGIAIAAISAGGDGPMGEDFRSLGPLEVLTPSTPQGAIDRALSALKANGYKRAIVNSAASGWLAPHLARNGIAFIGLIHELPGIIRQMHLEQALADMHAHARKIIYPAELVRDLDLASFSLPQGATLVRPQGLYHPIVLTSPLQKRQARERICAQIGASAQSHIVLGVGYADARKGIDIFLDWAGCVLRRRSDVHFIWAGKIAPEMEAVVNHRMKGELARHVHFVGFAANPADYYFAASVYALSSREDPFPSTVLEALAAATPVLLCKGASGSQALASDRFVVALPDAAPKTFADELDALLASPDAALSLGLQGRDLVRSRFGYASYTGAVADALDLGVPQISVIVPNYNYAQHLERRLGSILRQTLAPREIIFLDDASSDESLAVAERVLSHSDINWRIVVNAQNSGSVFSQWQRGVELASSNLLWIAEADDDADPHFLERASLGFSRAGVVLSYTQSKQMDGGGHIIAPDYLDYVRDIDPEKWRRGFFAEGLQEVREGLAVKNTIPNVSGVLFHRDTLMRVLSEHRADIASYRVAGDWCVYVNMLRHGSIAYHPAALNFHRRHDASVTISRFGLAELAEIARMQNYVAREFGVEARQAEGARAYLQQLVLQFDLQRKFSEAQLAGALRGVVAA